MTRIETGSAGETQLAAKLLADELYRGEHSRPAILALEGELGSGKTTFVQGFARALGVKEKVLSPTFVLLKIYALKKRRLRRLIHIDCYRVSSSKDLVHLGFRDLLRDKDAVILIEWADRVKKLIPQSAIWIRFHHSSRPHKRVIEFL